MAQLNELPLPERLTVALEMAQQLKELTKAAYGLPDMPDMDFSGMSMAEKMLLGRQQVLQLQKLATNIPHLKELDSIESRLTYDKSAELAAKELLARVKA